MVCGQEKFPSASCGQSASSGRPTEPTVGGRPLQASRTIRRQRARPAFPAATGADFSFASSDFKTLGAFFCSFPCNLVILAESRTVSRAPVYYILWVRGFRDPTISGREFNLFNLLRRHFRAAPFLPSGPLAPRFRRPKRLCSKTNDRPGDLSWVGAMGTNIEQLRNSGKKFVIAVMTFAFARIGAVVAMRVEDCYASGKRWWVRLHENGGKRHEMSAHHNLEAYLDAYIVAAGIRDAGKAPVFRSAIRRTGVLTQTPMSWVDAWRTIQRRAADLGTRVRIGCHTFRATGITRISKPAARWKTRRRWPRTKARARPSSMIGPAMRLRSLRSIELRFDGLAATSRRRC